MSYREQMQNIANSFFKTFGREAEAMEMAQWAISNGLWEAPRLLAVKKCAEDLADAMREEYETDAQGRRVRIKHAARIKKNGKQLTLWADIHTAKRSFIEIALQQRRQQIYGDCKQLKFDMDSFNENYNKGQAIQLSFDFTDDLEEEEALRKLNMANAAVV